MTARGVQAETSTSRMSSTTGCATRDRAQCSYEDSQYIDRQQYAVELSCMWMLRFRHPQYCHSHLKNSCLLQSSQSIDVACDAGIMFTPNKGQSGWPLKPSDAQMLSSIALLASYTSLTLKSPGRLSSPCHYE